eukprot:NODE_5734_length_1740_cov_3.659020.p8 GENE.NODE_5734_length_1740_cov_3.659020~~NODE_5734_length_1740_cov_3.659020.p8  ORF type:complete len:77 (+),score=9.19 NODE_5734_length_1740_cov_3.659020:211-441(+)
MAGHRARRLADQLLSGSSQRDLDLIPAPSDLDIHHYAGARAQGTGADVGDNPLVNDQVQEQLSSDTTMSHPGALTG